MAGLNDEQKRAFELYELGASFFLTGPGGAGKSYVIDAIRRDCVAREAKFLITALTGAAACLIGGKTVHSALGIGLGTGTAESLAAFARRNPTLRKRWQELQVLVIDEISMAAPELLDKIEEIGRILRRDKRPFGGVQVIVAGDFLQLPPVNKTSDEATFAFDAVCWPDLITETVELTTIIRQTDPAFQKILNEVRYGKASAETLEVLRGRVGVEVGGDGIEPTRLFSRNAAVDKINSERLEALVASGAETRTFKAFHDVKNAPGKRPSAAILKRGREFLVKSCPVPESMTLSVGTQLMCAVNIADKGLANGSRGVLTRFSAVGRPVVEFVGLGEVEMERHAWQADETGCVVFLKQYPLRLAFALSIHRCQGASLDLVEADLGPSVFESAQGYVALSRVRTLAGLSLTAFSERSIRAHPRVIAFMRGHEVSKSADRARQLAAGPFCDSDSE